MMNKTTTTTTTMGLSENPVNQASPIRKSESSHLVCVRVFAMPKDKRMPRLPSASSRCILISKSSINRIPSATRNK